MKDTRHTRNTVTPRPQITDSEELYELARGWLQQGNPVVATELLRSALESAEAGTDRLLRARILKEVGRALMMQSTWKDADTHYLTAQQLFVDAEEFVGAAECARNRGNMAFQQGDYEQSEVFCTQALAWATRAGDHQLRATILNTMGAIKSATGDHREAVKQFELCLADFRAVGNSIRQGYVLLNIGIAHTELQDYETANDQLKQALRIAFGERDQQLVQICYQNIAKCYIAQGEYKLARAVSETARRILPGLHSLALECELDLLDSRILRNLGDLKAASAVIERALKTAVEHDLAQLHADLLFEQAQLCKLWGKAREAISYLDIAISEYRKIGADQGVREAVMELEHLTRGHRDSPSHS